MQEFYYFLKRFIPHYNKYILGGIFLNMLSAILNVFSFSLIIPILQILFKINTDIYSLKVIGTGSLKSVLVNNFYYYMQHVISIYGNSVALLYLGLFLILMTLLKTGTYFASSSIMLPIRTGIVRDIRVLLYNKILYLPMKLFSKERKGDIIARMTGDVNEIDNSIINPLDILIKNPILILIYFGTLLVTNWRLTVFVLVILPLMGWIMGAVGKKLKRQSLVAQGKWSDTISQIEETLNGLRVIKSFIAEKIMKMRFAKCCDEYRKELNRVSIRQASAHPASELLGTILIVFVLWFGGTLVLEENSTINASGFIFYLVILYSIINPIKEIANACYSIPKGTASIQRINKILFAETENLERISGSLQFRQSIIYKNVYFSYGDQEILKDINIQINKGDYIAIIGRSGSGKSTFVDLLQRFYEVKKGEIIIDGVNIRNIDLFKLRNMIGIISQDVILFNDTFFNNIAFGAENVTREQVMEAAKAANAHDFIMNYDNNYDTFIGDNGCQLSGGQRQRISIARTILRKPSILIFDEATSALDTESEKLVQNAIERIIRDHTIIVVAHRLSTICNADRIYVMQKGRIVEQGRHGELIKANGYYKKLYDLQKL